MNLSEAAMQYAILNLDVPKEHYYGLMSSSLKISGPKEWEADELKRKMEQRFSPWVVQEAIKEAKETLKLMGLNEPN